MSTVTSLSATRPTALTTSCMAGQRAMTTSARSSAGASPATTAGTVMSRLMASARPTTWRTWLSSSGLRR